MNKIVVKPQVLLIEDDPIVGIVHTNFLEELGCVVIMGCNGKEALELAHKDISLIFMDMGLPDMLGIEVTKTLKNKFPHIPIIALTGYSSESSKQEFSNAGVNEIAIKPVFLEQLEQMLTKYKLFSTN